MVRSESQKPADTICRVKEIGKGAESLPVQWLKKAGGVGRFCMVEQKSLAG